MAGPQNVTDLKTLVQKMIDEGADEDVIHEVVTRYKSAQTPGMPISKDEPDTWWGGFFHALRPGGEVDQVNQKVLTGVAKGVPGGVASSVTGLASLLMGIPGTALAALGGIDSFQKDPAAFIKNLTNHVGPDLSANAQAMLHQAYTAATQDPEGYGNAVGHIIGQTGGGLATTAGAARLVTGLAPEVGAGLVKAGNSKLASGMMYMEGGRQLMHGDPTGIVTIAAPHIMKKIGEGIAAKFPVALDETGVLSAADRASLLKQGMTPEKISVLEAQMQADVAPKKGTIRMTGQAPKYPVRPPGERSTLTDLVGGAPDVAADTVAAERLGMKPDEYAAWKADRQARINKASKTPVKATEPGESTVPAAAETGTRSAQTPTPEGEQTGGVSADAEKLRNEMLAPDQYQRTPADRLQSSAADTMMNNPPAVNKELMDRWNRENGGTERVTFRGTEGEEPPAGGLSSLKPRNPSDVGPASVSNDVEEAQPSSYEQALMNTHVPEDLTHEGQAAAPGETVPGPRVYLRNGDTERSNSKPLGVEITPTQSSHGKRSDLMPHITYEDELIRQKVLEENPQISDEDLNAKVLQERQWRNNMYRSGTMETP